jgi:hypothetical protein
MAEQFIHRKNPYSNYELNGDTYLDGTAAME